MNKNIKYISVAIFFISISYSKTDMIILKSTETSLTIEMEIDAVTAADIYSKSIFVGLPNNVFPKTELIFKEESSIPFRSEKSNSEIFFLDEYSNTKKFKYSGIKN